MAAITLQRLKILISEAYTSGYHGSLDMNDSYIEDVIKKLLDTPEPLTKNDGWKTYKVIDLRVMPVGTIFDHQSRGKGWTEGNTTERYMRFHTGEICHFYSDEYPWNEPMRLIGTTTKKPKKL